MQDLQVVLQRVMSTKVQNTKEELIYRYIPYGFNERTHAIIFIIDAPILKGQTKL